MGGRTIAASRGGGSYMADDERLRALINDPNREQRLATYDPSILPVVLLGYRTATISVESALLKLEVLVQGESPEVAILPIAMSRSQCTELGDALKRLAILPYQPDQKAN